MTPEVADVIARQLEGTDSRVHADHPIGPLTTYRCGGNAALFIEPACLDDVRSLVGVLSPLGIESLVIGNGSNMLIASAGFSGVAIHLGDSFETMELDVSDDGAMVTVGAGASLPRVARFTVKQGLTGFEWAVGVPGTIGGAVRMNAGGHGSDMAASVIDATILDLATGKLGTWTAEELTFAYRTSALQRHHCVLEARLRLDPGDSEAGETLLSDIVRWRREHQPGGQNAGSVFTNPEGDSAGRLIDSSGCKGMRVGSAEVSEKHANFIQVDDKGNADDVHALMIQIRDHVLAETGIELHAETHLVGFGSATLPAPNAAPSTPTPTPNSLSSNPSTNA